MDTLGISYVLANLTDLGLSFARPGLLFLAALAPLFFIRIARPQRGAAVLRAGAFLAVVCALAGARLTFPLPENRLALVVAVDVSESVGEPARRWSERLLSEVARTMAPGDELAVITFAGDTRLARPLSPPAAVRQLPLPRVLTATDLGAAIDNALALFPADRERHLLLITDGNETRGNSRRAIPVLRADGIRVDVVVPPGDERPDVRVDKLVVPPALREAGILPLRVIAHNHGKERSGVLNLFLDGSLMDSAAVELRPGLNSFELPSRVTGQGSHLLRAQLDVPNDGMAGNNYQEASLTVRGPTRILLATAGQTSPLVQALEDKGFAVDVTALHRLSGTEGELRAYHAVILEDVNAEAMPDDVLEQIERWVLEFGGGLVLAAGEATFGDAGFVDSALGRMLPLTLETRRPKRGAREPLALFLLIDRSNSMGYNSRIGTLRDGEKLRYAKESALAVIRQLKDQDLVGVIAFDSQSREISALRPLRENRATLEELLPRLVENGGTDFYGALESAREQLAASRVSRRHVVLLTDGDTNRSDPDEYDALLSRITKEQITVTTIRIGDNTINLNLLQRISRQTGGQFHHVENAEMLPDLMLQDTTKALTHLASGSREFFPKIGSRSQILRGIKEKDMPPLLDYAFAKAKQSADVPMQVTRMERTDPLLATWQYGLGRVAAFAASPSRDAVRWVSWPEYSKFWSQLVRWTARAQTPDEYTVAVQRRKTETVLEVRSFEVGSDPVALVARLHLGPEDVREVALVPRAPRLYRGALGEVPGGRYPLTLLQRVGPRVVSERTLLVTIPDGEQQPQEEYRAGGPNQGLLTQLTEDTGGRLNPTAKEISQRKPGKGVAFYPLDTVLIPLAMLLFLSDIAWRRRLTRDA